MSTPHPGHVVLTGPISGTLVVNGQVVNVTPDTVVVDSLEQAQAIADAIADAHVESGHLLADDVAAGRDTTTDTEA